MEKVEIKSNPGLDMVMGVRKIADENKYREYLRTAAKTNGWLVVNGVPVSVVYTGNAQWNKDHCVTGCGLDANRKYYEVTVWGPRTEPGVVL